MLKVTDCDGEVYTVYDVRYDIFNEPNFLVYDEFLSKWVEAPAYKFKPLRSEEE